MMTDDFSAVAIVHEVASSEGVDGSDVKAATLSLMSALASESTRAGAYLIGNIKAAVSAEGGFLASSIVMDGAEPSLAGSIPGRPRRIRFVINALLYGVPEQELERLALRLVAEHLTFDGADCRTVLAHEPERPRRPRYRK